MYVLLCIKLGIHSCLCMGVGTCNSSNEIEINMCIFKFPPNIPDLIYCVYVCVCVCRGTGTGKGIWGTYMLFTLCFDYA